MFVADARDFASIASLQAQQSANQQLVKRRATSLEMLVEIWHETCNHASDVFRIIRKTRNGGHTFSLKKFTPFSGGIPHAHTWPAVADADVCNGGVSGFSTACGCGGRANPDQGANQAVPSDRQSGQE